MSLLMRVLCDWNRECGNRSDSARARVVMPTICARKTIIVLLLRIAWAMRFLPAHTKKLAIGPRWCKAFMKKHNISKLHRLGADFVANITIAQAVPGLLPLFLAYSRCLATAALTNLGDVTRRFRRRFPNNEAGKCWLGVCRCCVVTSRHLSDAVRAPRLACAFVVIDSQ